MRKIFYLIIAALTFQGCNPRDRINREVFEEVNESMKVKKLSEVEIMQSAMEWGEEISAQAQEQLIGALQEAITSEGVAGAIGFCNVQALPILHELSQKHGVNIRRASVRYRNPENSPLEHEEAILDAYAYNAENNIKNEPNIQKLKNGEVLLYTKAIQIPGGLCLNCHGQYGKDINEETEVAIKNSYPEDKATGHNIGDLRGMWSISIPKKEVVKRM